MSGESSDVWNMICAVIQFHRASCLTQMSARHVSTDNVLTKKPLAYSKCGDMLLFKWLLSPSPLLFSYSLAIPFLCLHPYLHQWRPPFPRPSPTALLWIHLDVAFLPFNPSSLSSASQPCSGYIIAVCSRGWGCPALLAHLMSSGGDRTNGMKSCVLKNGMFC